MVTFNADPTKTDAATTLAEPEPVVVSMEIYTDVLKRFMKKYNRFEPVSKDHTQVITFKTCPRKYFYQIVLGRVAKEEAIYFAWGSAYHQFREWLEKAYGLGASRPAQYDVERAGDAFTAGVNAGMNYWRKHGQDQPVGSKWEFMTGERLLRSFMTAFAHWTREKQQGRIEVLAVEQLFNVRLPNGERTSGRADQIVRWNGRLWGRDFKTSSKDEAFYQRQVEPNDQFTRYTYSEAELCGEPIQGQMIEVLYNAKSTKKETKGPQVFTLVASRTTYQVQEWVQDEIMWRKFIDLAREEDRYPMAEVSCPFCPYHSVCTKPSEEGMMAQLESFYVVRPWDNAKIGLADL
jgi:hypothetical protein